MPESLRRSLVAVRDRGPRFAGAGVVLAVALVAWVALLYGVSWHLIGGTSDNATAVLAGRDMVHGNVLLHGWHLGADSFVLLDLPLLGFEAKMVGLGPAVFHVVPTALAACTVLLAMFYASRRANGRYAAVAIGTTFVIIGLPSSLFAAFFLQGPIHVMTTLFCLLAFGLLTPGQSPQRQVGGSFLLLIAVSSDPLALAIGVVPVIAAGIAVSRTKHGRDGSPLVAAGVLAAAGGEGLVRAVTALGGFRRLPTIPLVARSQWVPNLHLAAHDFLYMFGVRVLARWPYVAWPARFIHLAGLGFAVAAVAVAGIDFGRRVLVGRGRGTWIDDVCVVGFVGSVAFFVLVVFPGENVSRTRYLLPAMVFGAILAGRFSAALIGGALDRARVRSTGDARAWRATRAVAVATAVVLVVGYAAETTASVRNRNRPNAAIALAAWLSAHDLTEGLGGYWDATVTTVASGDHVRVQPVIAVRGHLHGFGSLASDTWFSPDSSNRAAATFLVYEPKAPWGDVNLATATASFGQPEMRRRVGNFEVLIWNHDTRAQLRPVVIS